MQTYNPIELAFLSEHEALTEGFALWSEGYTDEFSVRWSHNRDCYILTVWTPVQAQIQTVVPDSENTDIAWLAQIQLGEVFGPHYMN